MKPIRFKIKTAWYLLLFGASMMPALVMAPWLIDKSQNLLLENSLLKEKVFHQDISIRITLESKRLLTILENKADFISEQLTHNENNHLYDIFGGMSLREPIINSISLFDKKFKPITVFKEVTHEAPKLDASSPELMIPLQGRSFISAPKKLTDGHFEFLVSVPVFHNNQVIAILASSININEFWMNIKTSLPEHESEVYLIDNRGSLLTSLSRSQHVQGELLSKSKVVRSLLADKPWNNMDSYKGFEGNQVFGIGSVIDNVDWGIISEIPSHKIMTEIYPLLTTLGGIIFLAHLAFGLIGFFFTHRLLTPISTAVNVAEKVAEGHFDIAMPNNSYISEIYSLSLAFNNMVHELDSRERSMKQMQKAMEQAGESIIISDRHGKIEYANSAYCKASGFDLDECIGKTVRMMMQLDLHPKKYFAPIWQKINQGETWSGELKICKKDGSNYPVFMSISPIFEGKTITHFLAIQQDISQQEALESQLRQSQKMEAVGVLAGGVSHEFNNILAGITGNLYLAKMKLQRGPECEEAESKIEKAERLCHKAATMVSHLLSFSRQSMLTIDTFCLNKVILESLDLSKLSITKFVCVDHDITETPLYVHGDHTQVNLMLINLLSNATYALKKTAHPHITISLKHFVADQTFALKHPELTAPSYALFTIEDNGAGMSPEDLDNIYKPFFTTKPVGEGTGLGLSMVYGAIQSLSGLIEASSEIGKGTTFNLYFPLHSKDTEEDTSFDNHITPPEQT
ncbi:MAG: ATP-binding protein [Ghiorsea sp.]